MQLTRRSQNKFADLAAQFGKVRAIEEAYEAHDFDCHLQLDPAMSGIRRATCQAYEDGIDLTDPGTAGRLLRVYVDGIEDWGQTDDHFTFGPEDRDPLVDEARALVKSLQKDGAPVDNEGNLVLGAAPVVLQVERFDLLREPQAVLEHLKRIEAGIAADPAAAIASSKELTETACKLILDDYGVTYAARTDLPELYKLVAQELKLTRESVPASAKGSRSAQKVLQNFVTTIQSLAELRNELGLGHGRTSPSAALARHGAWPRTPREPWSSSCSTRGTSASARRPPDRLSTRPGGTPPPPG